MRRRGGGIRFEWAWAIPLAVAATIGLGTWGWLAQGQPADEAFYRSLALFQINANDYSGGESLTDWRFRVGRWTGAGAVFTSLVALAALLRDRLAGAFARLGRRAVLVAGDGDLALAAFEAASAAGKRVLWIGAPGVAAPSFNAYALPWPTEEKTRAVFEHARRADHVLIAAEDDAEALAMAQAARAAAADVYVTALMRDALLAEDGAARLGDARSRVLGLAPVIARAVMSAHPPFLIARELGHPRVNALLVGFGQIGQALARDLIVNGRTTYLAAPRLMVLDPAAPALEAVMRLRAPELDACAEVDFIEGEIGARALNPGPAALLERLSRGGPITAVYVNLPTDAASLTALGLLRALLREAAIEPPPVFVRLSESGEVFRHGAGLVPFGGLDAVLQASEFLDEAPDGVARAFCEAYRASLTAAQRADPANRGAYPWARLDETYRQANRDAVAHIAAKLASAGIDPGRWRGVAGLPTLAPGERLFADEAELETLSELEHERWMAQRRMDGWRFAPERDDARRHHPQLRPYAALSEEMKALDRVYVRQTARACGAAD